MSQYDSQRLLGSSLPSSGRWIDIAFPGISMDKSIVWISIAQIGFYILSCAMSSSLEPTERALYHLGAAYGPGLKHFELWRAIMPVFLHVGIIHLIFNVSFILHMGLDKEAKYGKRDFLTIYFVSALIGNLLSMLGHPCALAVGASTAGFGLIGCIATEISLVWNKLDERVRNVYTTDIVVFGALMILLSYGQTVDIWGHLGGFIAGVAVTCHLNKDIRDVPQWFELVHSATKTLCIAILILTPMRVFLGIPVPMGCA